MLDMFPIPANPMSSYPILFTLVFPKPKYDWKRLNGVWVSILNLEQVGKTKKRKEMLRQGSLRNESQGGIQLTMGNVLNM